jgi:hypothetical protein
MSTLPLPAQTLNVAHLNDTEILDSYKHALTETIATFMSLYGRAPIVLNIGAQAGLLARFALEADAQFVVIVDANLESLSLARETLKQYNNFSLIHSHSTQFSHPTKFDILVFDLFGAAINDKGASFIVYDILSRQMLQRYDNQFFVIPCEGAMSVRLYHAPELGLHHHASYYQMPLYKTYNNTAPKSIDAIKWQVNTTNMFQPWSQLKALSPRVEVLHEMYDKVTSPTWPSHITLGPIVTPASLPSSTDIAAGTVLLVQEWSVALTPSITIRNTTTGSYVRRHGWGLAWSVYPTDMATTSTTWSVSPKNSGGVTLAVVPEPVVASVKTHTAKKITLLLQNTFAKAALANQMSE